MKKATGIIFLGLILTTIVLSGCLFSHEHSNTTVAVQDSDDWYRFSAHYDKRKTKRVQHYMDVALNAPHTFVNADMDANITLKDQLSLYVKAHPGILQIRFNKRDNGDDAYLKLKRLEEGIKAILSTN